MDIVSWAFSQSSLDENKPLYIDPANPSRCISRSKSRQLICQLIRGLRNNGLDSGDCVCVMSFNDIHYTSIFLGIVGAGGCFTGINPGYTSHEVSHHLRLASSKFLLVSSSPTTFSSATIAAQECGIPSSNIFVLDFEENEVLIPGYRSWKELLCLGEEDWVHVPDPDNVIAAYFSTSGTSGLPKAAAISHSYLVNQGEFQIQTADVPYELSTLIALPPFHAFTFPLQHMLPLRTNTSCCILPRFSSEAFLFSLFKYQITQTAVVPPIIVELSKNPNAHQLASLRRIYTAGSCASDGIQQQLYAKLHPETRIEQIYGMTECGWATKWQRAEIDGTGSVGQPLPGYQLRLVSAEGNVITEDEVKGELHIFTPHPFKTYINNKSATEETLMDDGWIRTGDIAYVKDGNWYIIDRIKDLIKVRGWQVSPTEIEAVLLQHVHVADAAVIGVPLWLGNGDEVPIAFVVRTKDSTIDEKTLNCWVSGRLARYKHIQGVKFVESIPRNPAGKILKRILRDTMRDIVQQKVSVESEEKISVKNAYKEALIALQLKRQKSFSSRGSLTSLSSDGTSCVNSSTDSEMSENTSHVAVELHG